jgi:hypothetical protein
MWSLAFACAGGGVAQPKADSAPIPTDTAPPDDSAADTADTGSTDADGDGSPDANDCRPDDPSVYPGAPETCDGLDNDCNSAIDDVDADADRYVDEACGGNDCDDADASVNPGADEVCDNGRDDDCDGGRNDCPRLEGEYGIDDAVAWIVGEGEGYYSGGQALSIGDADGDGVGDLLVAARWAGDSYLEWSGAAYVVRGGDFPSSLADAWARWDGEPMTLLGWDLAPAGDADGDGRADAWLVGGPDFGVAWLAAGIVAGANAVGTGSAIEGSVSAGTLHAVECCGDLDGDGAPELLTYSTDDDRNGGIYILHGPDPGSRTLDGADGRVIVPDMGAGVLVGDTDGDGLADVAAPLYEPGSGTLGIFVFRGPLPESGGVEDADAMLTSPNVSDNAGNPMDGLGDADGDGLDDLLLGAETDDDGGSNAGAAYVVFAPLSSRDLADGAAKLTGVGESGNAGESVCPLGDVDGDGWLDFAMGAGRYDGGAASGVLYLEYGPFPPGTWSAGGGALILGDEADPQGGFHCGGGGDLTGDGVPDRVVMQHNYEDDTGRVGIYAGMGR